MDVQLMDDDDAAYSALLAQLLSDSASTRNARVNSWIEHQYDFVLSEQDHLPFASSRPPSPSPSSSLGALRHPSIDRPDSPLLPRVSSDRSPSYDDLFFPADHDDFEEKERLRALRFIVQEMAHWKSQSSLSHSRDKSLPAPPPSPASTTHSSRVMRSRSSSTCISRLPSFTSTLSSDQSQPQEVPPPLPVSVIVHGECQHDLILRDRPIVDGYSHKRDDSFPHPHDQDAQYLSPLQDDKDSFQPSPTLSNFSCAYSRETSFTTPYGSSPASPASAIFSCSPSSPEHIALPASPVEQDQPLFIAPSAHHRTSSSRSARNLNPTTVSPPKTNVLLASPTSDVFSIEDAPPEGAPHLLALKSAAQSQSRWSVATTASLAPSAAEPKPSEQFDPRTASKFKKNLKTPKKRTRFISLISRFSPGRTDPASTTASSQTGDEVEYDSLNDSDMEDREKNKPRKSLSKKPSLASLRASFSLSRASFSSQRPLASSVDDVPPLPTSPTRTSSFPEAPAPSEVAPPLPRPSLSRIPSRATLLNSILPPIPQSASTITTFQSSSQVSICDTSPPSAAESRVSLVCPAASTNGSRISLLPPPSKRTSLTSAPDVEPVVWTKSLPADQATTRSKSIFRLTAKSKSLKTPVVPGTKETGTPSRLPVAGNNTSLSSPTTVRSRIPQAPTKFNPPAKLATVIATQSRQAPALASPAPISPTSKLPMPPSRTPAKVPRPNVISVKPPAEGLPSLSPSSRLPMPASVRGARVGTVKGFWKRQ